MTVCNSAGDLVGLTWIRPLFFFVMTVLSHPIQAQETAAVQLPNQPAVKTSEDPRKDSRVVHLGFDGLSKNEGQGRDLRLISAMPSDASTIKPGRVVGSVDFTQQGPRPPRFPAFSEENPSAKFTGGGSIRFLDPGNKSVLDFGQGDSITIEAWVAPIRISNGQNMYVVGKGRTNNEGVASENQNYALRLSGEGGDACLSFLFRDHRNRKGHSEDFHRWTTTSGFGANGSWHHVAVTYTFGKSDSIHGYIDGKPLAGKWDYGGATNEAPWVDDDELWIGSAMGGNPGSSFEGMMDEVVIHRESLSESEIKSRCVIVQPPSYVTPPPVSRTVVQCEIFEGIPDQFSWEFPVPSPTESWENDAFGLIEIPHKYNSHGVREDRSNPLMVRMTGWHRFPDRKSRCILRSHCGARLFVDGELVASNSFPQPRGDGHGELYEVDTPSVNGIRPAKTGDRDCVFEIAGNGKERLITLEVFAGGKKHRPEFGETGLWIEKTPGIFSILGTSNDAWTLTDDGWFDFSRHQRHKLDSLNQRNRSQRSIDYANYWKKRHDEARNEVASWKPITESVHSNDLPVRNLIDQFINARLAVKSIDPLPLTDDAAFLRRVSLDLIGVIPSLDLAKECQETDELNSEAEVQSKRLNRGKLIDRLLDHPGWADHWVGYWQDVLAENPNIVNPTLNNTGPFRWWLHESFSDNKPFDRFATELILMEGSTHYGGPAGFGVATQNDAPMAAKAHVLAQAFLAMEMKCARCHDAPYHDFQQKDLFSLAAMLRRGDEKVPKTSTIPGDAVASLLVKVTLKPGEAITPNWPFAEKLKISDEKQYLLKPDDQREHLAALVTSPRNHRFAQVIVNRLWHRFLGRGLVEPIDDWENVTASHPELLEYLERELIESGYDLKHVARLILNSHVYQRRCDPIASSDSMRASLFAGPVARRMSAEQVVDSLFAAVGKPFNVEEMSVDVDSQRSYESSLSMGVPQRAWQFASLSNERDRPALSLPAASNIINVLETFGWRASRPDPVSVRPFETTVLQPAVLSNGVATKRIAQLSDDSLITELALQEKPLVEFIDLVFQAILTRPASSEERELFRELLQEGYDSRCVSAPVQKPKPPKDTGVTWSNHLKPEASDRKLALARELELGDVPTKRLQTDWRERAEDMVWALINSPEFLFIP